jgi:hypothetical protein
MAEADPFKVNPVVYVAITSALRLVNEEDGT